MHSLVIYLSFVHVPPCGCTAAFVQQHPCPSDGVSAGTDGGGACVGASRPHTVVRQLPQRLSDMWRPEGNAEYAFAAWGTRPDGAAASWLGAGRHSETAVASVPAGGRSSASAAAYILLIIQNNTHIKTLAHFHLDVIKTLLRRSEIDQLSCDMFFFFLPVICPYRCMG